MSCVLRSDECVPNCLLLFLVESTATSPPPAKPPLAQPTVPVSVPAAAPAAVSVAAVSVAAVSVTPATTVAAATTTHYNGGTAVTAPSMPLAPSKTKKVSR